MLVEFTAGNYWSFKEEQTLQLQAAKIKSRYPKVDTANVAPIDKQLELLKSKAVFGANASGKTNLVRAMSSMLAIIKNCLSDSETLQKNISPFLYSEQGRRSPTFFQIIFTLGEIQYRYGFEADREHILAEWLFGKYLRTGKKVKERYYFLRDDMKVTVNPETFKEGKSFTGSTQEPTPLYRNNSLFLSVVAAWNGTQAQAIVRHFQTDYIVLSGLDDEQASQKAIESLIDPSFQAKVAKLLRAVDPTISRIEKLETAPSGQAAHIHGEAGHVAVFRKNNTGEEVPISLFSQDAEGTKKVFTLSPFIFSALEGGKVLFIDEFDARMHPKLSRKLVELFHDPDSNPHNAQLIFITHDSKLLDAKLLRRDQIAFAQKHSDGASELYSLAEFKGVRNDASFEKDYLMGKYKAVPSHLNYVEEAIIQYIHGEENQKDG